MEGISVHCKGKGPCLKGESGLEKKESEIILRKIGSFVWFVQVGSGYTRVIQDALALSSLSHTLFFWQVFTKSFPSSELLLLNLTLTLQAIVSTFCFHAVIGRQRTCKKNCAPARGLQRIVVSKI